MTRLRSSPRHDLIGAPTNQTIEWKWRNFLRIKENPWLADYQIDNIIQLSPAALICTVVEAGRQITKGRNSAGEGFELRDISFPKALVLPDDGIEVYTELQVAGKLSEAHGSVTKFRFHIFTVADSEPVSHCTGLLKVDCKSIATAPSDWIQFAEHLAIERSPQDFYKTWSSSGIQWGTLFFPSCHPFAMLTAHRTSIPAAPKHTNFRLYLENRAAAEG